MLRAAFWRFAHKRYQMRKPMFLLELLGFLWSGFWGLLYAAALVIDPTQLVRSIPFLFVWIGIPLGITIAYRRIRREREKGDDALYRKRLSVEPDRLD